MVLRRKKKKSLDYNNSFLGEYECSSLALDREERRDEKEEIGSLETRSNNENPTVTAGGPGGPRYIWGPPGLSGGRRRLTLPFLSFSGEGFICPQILDLRKRYQEHGYRLLNDESIDSAFARFNTTITSLKALDEGYSSKNYVRKFLRALHPKYRAKVTAIEESKDLTSLSLDELIGNLKVHEMIIKKDSKIVKAKVERKSIALKAKKESSDEECLTSGSEDEEYAMAVRDFKCGDPNHLIGECPKQPKDKNQRAFVGGSWSNSGEDDYEKVKNKTCLVAHASSEMCLGVDLEPDEWIKDSGCSKHMTGNRKLFSTYKAYNGGNVIFGSNLRGNIIGKGTISNDSLKIDNVEHVDNLGFNLLSIGQICDNKCRVTFSKHDSEITKDGKVIGRV
ncbi:retrovirus-related pol polyprotein from transposon TNT 1-94 [Tanacetum coccineum]